MESLRLSGEVDRPEFNRPNRPTLDKYDIYQTLGRGAYGVVYHVRSRTDMKFYALKQLEVKLTNEGMPQSILRELSIMKSLCREDHPNILKLESVFHTFLADSSIVHINLVLEKCDWDLFSFLRDIPKALPEHQCRYIACQIMYALDFLHSHNIVHRDLKPQNILINRDQSIRIADFGLSRSYSNTSAFTTLVVTLWYRSPEILLQSYYDSSADVWAAGCIISEVFNRTALFTGQSEAEQLKIIFEKMGTPTAADWPQDAIVDLCAFKKHPARDVKLYNPSLSNGAANMINRCLTFNRLKRLTAKQAMEHSWIKQPQRKVLKPLHFNKQNEH